MKIENIPHSRVGAGAPDGTTKKERRAREETARPETTTVRPSSGGGRGGEEMRPRPRSGARCRFRGGDRAARKWGAREKSTSSGNIALGRLCRSIQSMPHDQCHRFRRLCRFGQRCQQLYTIKIHQVSQPFGVIQPRANFIGRAGSDLPLLLSMNGVCRVLKLLHCVVPCRCRYS